MRGAILRAVGVCHSDRSIQNGTLGGGGRALPVILGHREYGKFGLEEFLTVKGHSPIKAGHL